MGEWEGRPYLCAAAVVVDLAWQRPRATCRNAAEGPSALHFELTVAAALQMYGHTGTAHTPQITGTPQIHLITAAQRALGEFFKSYCSLLTYTGHMLLYTRHRLSVFGNCWVQSRVTEACRQRPRGLQPVWMNSYCISW